MRRLIALALAAVLLLTSGCARLFTKEYVSSRDYEDPETVDNADTTEIHDYAGLQRQLNAMVAGFETGRSLIFTDYDGIIADDLSKACWELRSNTALGAYCVRDIEYTTEQVVAYCEADISISYKRTEDEVKGLANVQSRTAIGQTIAQAITEQKTRLAVLMNTNAMTEGDVADLALQTCLDNPMAAVALPEIDVTMYAGETNQKIFEINLRYPLSQSETEQRRQALQKAVDAIAADLDREDPACALQAAAAVAERCAADGETGGTAYEALVLGRADSQGLAMAYRAVCEALDVKCTVVNGQLDSGVHVWNIVTLEGQPYHLDLVGYHGTLWLQPDRDIWGRYWWNVERYPTCGRQGFSWQPGEELQIPEG